MRQTREAYYMDIAITTSKRSTCDRAQVGAIAVQDNRIIATGFNGSPSGWRHCDDAGHKLVGGHCVRTIHAEMNLVCQAAKFGISLNGAVVYTTHEPCFNCIKHLVNAGVKEIHFFNHKRDKTAKGFENIDYTKSGAIVRRRC